MRVRCFSMWRRWLRNLRRSVTRSRGVFSVELQHLVEVLFSVEQFLSAEVLLRVEVIVQKKHSQERRYLSRIVSTFS